MSCDAVVSYAAMLLVLPGFISSVMLSSTLDSLLYYLNKSTCIVDEVHMHGARLDASIVHEFEHAVPCVMNGDDVCQSIREDAEEKTPSCCNS